MPRGAIEAPGRGQLPTGSQMDYAMPRAEGAPIFASASYPVPAATNPLGAKAAAKPAALARCPRELIFQRI